MKNRFDLVVFDWDGTLYDSIPFIVGCLQAAANDCGRPHPSAGAARSVIGLSLQRAMRELFAPADDGECEELISAYRRHYAAREAGPTDLFVGVADLLVRLREGGYRMAVASGKSSRQLATALDATGTAAWFDTLRGPDQTASKPDPLMLREIMRDLNAVPERTLMVGDSLHDLQMAVNAGVDAVAVACGANSVDELRTLQPLWCLQQTRELAGLLL